MPAHFENGKNWDVTKILVSVPTKPAQFENGRNLGGTELLAMTATKEPDLDDKEIYISLKSQSALF